MRDVSGGQHFPGNNTSIEALKLWSTSTAAGIHQHEMRDLGNLLADKGYAEDRDLIVTKRCGEGVKASSLKRDQTDIMEALILDFQNFLDELNDN